MITQVKTNLGLIYFCNTEDLLYAVNTVADSLMDDEVIMSAELIRGEIVEVLSKDDHSADD